MLFLMGLSLMAGQPVTATSSVSELPAWVAGVWTTADESGGWTEEWWSTPRAGIMLGASRSGKGDVLGFFEHARIVRSERGLEFCALPQGKAGACFPAVAATAAEIVFENGANDYPTRIIYRKTATGLEAEISGPGGSRRQSWQMKPLGN